MFLDTTAAWTCGSREWLERRLILQGVDAARVLRRVPSGGADAGPGTVARYQVTWNQGTVLDVETEDHIDQIVKTWRLREPDLDVAHLHVVGRLLLAAGRVTRARERALQPFRLTAGDFDVMATLHRAAPPEGLNSKHLSTSALITSGAMTTRLDRLERAGMIERRPDPSDRRAVLVLLTNKGRRTAADAVRAVFRAHEECLQPLSDGERKRLAAGLRLLLPDEQT